MSKRKMRVWNPEQQQSVCAQNSHSLGCRRNTGSKNKFQTKLQIAFHDPTSTVYFLNTFLPILSLSGQSLRSAATEEKKNNIDCKGFQEILSPSLQRAPRVSRTHDLRHCLSHFKREPTVTPNDQVALSYLSICDKLYRN